MRKMLFFLWMAAAAMTAGAQLQLPNPGFEQWGGDITSEPDHWNSFATAEGSYASLASSPHHYRRNGGRPGSTGNYFLTIYTKSIIGIKANGNMTTGRIHAGSMSASSSSNFNFTKRSHSEFSQPFSGTPDSMYVWVSFYAASGGSQARVSAILHGENDFRSPNHDNQSDLYCGKAFAQFTRTTASPREYGWSLVKAPFVYDGNDEGRYMLVNITTNATPGSGSGNDSLSIDDIEFVYSAWLLRVYVEGRQINNFRRGRLNYTVRVNDPALLETEDITYLPEVDDATVVVGRERVDDTSTLVTLDVTAEDNITTRRYSIMLTTGNPESAYTLGIDAPAAATPLKVYPNPATDGVSVEAEGEVTLTNMGGRTLEQRQVHGTSWFSLAHLPAGTYLVRCGNTVRCVVKL